MRYLTVSNTKTKRGESLGILTAILHFNPEVSDKVCPYASEHCKLVCLNRSGRAEKFPMILEARTRKTLAFYNDQPNFMLRLHKDIQALIKRAKKLGMRPAVRLNGTSDILWERYINFSQYPEVQFYDYTKIPLRFRKLAPNYHLTFSFSGSNWNDCRDAIAQGVNVAVVFNAKTPPASYQGLDVIDGTDHDVRFLDAKKGAIVGLIPKGKNAKLAAKNGSPFIVQVTA